MKAELFYGIVMLHEENWYFIDFIFKDSIENTGSMGWHRDSYWMILE